MTMETKLSEEEISELVKKGRQELTQIDAYEADFKSHPSEYSWQIICKSKDKVKEIKALLGDDAHRIGEDMHPGSHP